MTETARLWESGAWWRDADSGIATRIEDKFVVATEAVPALRAKLMGQLQLDWPRSGIQWSKIESCYFDGPGLELFHDALEAKAHRYKVRIRRYGPNGVWDEGTWFLELKAKDGAETCKVRIAIGPRERARLTRGGLVGLAPTGDLERRNPELTAEALRTRVNIMNEVFAHYPLKPVCTVSYRREAFKAADGTRVTLDTNIETKLHLASAQAAWDAPAILEVKHAGKIDRSLNDVLTATENAGREFSKYCAALQGVSDRPDKTPAR